MSRQKPVWWWHSEQGRVYHTSHDREPGKRINPKHLRPGPVAG